MNSAVNTKFAVKPVAAALALVLSAATAYAAPTPNQMPGAGLVSALSGGANVGAIQVNGVLAPLGTAITGLTNLARIDILNKVVLNWGVSTVVDPTNPSGFNLGSAATLFFGASNLSTTVPAVLNVDVSGNNSQIYGNLISTSATWAGCVICTIAPAIFVSNANGITVAAGARIVAPTGLGLVGADLSGAKWQNDFVGNNGWIVPAAPSYGNSYVDVPVGSSGPITMGGAINGDFVLNTPALYVFVAGGNVNVLNTANVFANNVFVEAGMTANQTTDAINGVSQQTVNRLWNVDAQQQAACCTVAPGSNEFQIGAAGANFVNAGSISSKLGASAAYIVIGASGNITSGTVGDPNTQVGLFADSGIYIDSYSNTSSVQLYNVISGYSTNRTLPLLSVNHYAFSSLTQFTPDVTIQTIKPGSGQPSPISTTNFVSIFGGDITINSAINDMDAAHGGTQQDYSLTIVGTKAVNVAANVGAGANVNIIDTGGNLVISGNVLSDTNSDGHGGINITNGAVGATTVISGNLLVPSSATSSKEVYVHTHGPLTVSGAVTATNGDVYLYNYGTRAGNFTTISGNVTAGNNVNIYNSTSLNAKPLTVSGNVTAGHSVYISNNGSSSGESTLVTGNVTTLPGGHDIYILNNGLANSQLTITGTLNAARNAYIGSNGNAQVRAVYAGSNIYASVGGIGFLIDGPWGSNSSININAPIAMTRLKPAAVLSSPNIFLNVLNFQGVNAAGTTYANAGQKPTAQLVTNNLGITIAGTINAGILNNTNWPLNSMDIMPFFGLDPVFVSITANGGGFQAVNLAVLGNGVFNSGATTTPFIAVPLTSGALPAGGIQGNLGSQLILQTTGSMTINGTPTFTLFGPPTAFQWPGGAAFIAGTTLQTTAPIYNAWSVASPPYGGVFFTSPYIQLGSYIATSGTAWANFSSAPVTGFPTVYQIHNLTPTVFGFTANPFAVVKNDYTKTVVGGAVCTITGPTTFTACP